MWSIFVLSSIFFLNSHLNQACHIEFNKLDQSYTIRRVYEEDIFNITGQLQYCPSSIMIRNLSLTNPSLKRISILNVSYFIETNQIQITALARLIGFAPLIIQLYFKDDDNQLKFVQHSLTNTTIKQNQCSTSSSNSTEILRKCPTLRFEHDYYILTENITIAIKRRQTVIDTLFTVVVMILLTIGRLCIGCNLEIEQFINHLQRPIPLIVGLICQIIYLPILSALICKIFSLDNSTSLGLLSTASSPGGVSSNIYTAVLTGDVDLSIVMTFFSTITSFGTFPFWIRLLGENYIDFQRIRFPWWSMFFSFITIFSPALTGLLLRQYRLALAHRIGRFLHPLTIAYLVFILTFGVYINMHIFYIIDFKAIIASCLLPWFGFVGGAIISFITINDKKKTIAICIETGVQNTAIAIFCLRLTFPEPEADIALATPILVAMATPIPFLLIMLMRYILQKCPFYQKVSSKKAHENETE